MAAGDLTSLANVKAWLGVTTTNDDALLSRLITSASRFVINYIQRPQLTRHTVNETRVGTGNSEMMLREYPVIQVNSLTVRGQGIDQQVSPPFGPGFVLDAWDGQDTSCAQKIYTVGSLMFRDYVPTVVVNYDAGFYVTEVQNVPSEAPYTLSTMRTWAADGKISYLSNGNALTPVAANPAQGQYIAAQGSYTFSSADDGEALTIAYSYTPADLEQAVIELVGERYRVKDRIGMVSKSLGGQETVAFSQRNLNAFIISLLSPFMDVTPI